MWWEVCGENGVYWEVYGECVMAGMCRECCLMGGM